MQLSQDGLLLEGGDEGSLAWFQSTSAKQGLQAASSVGETWDSPESALNPRGVTGRIPVAPLPAMSFPVPARLSSKTISGADLDSAAKWAPLPAPSSFSSASQKLGSMSDFWLARYQDCQHA